MSDMKSCMYEIYGWMGVVGKYTGCFPLPGLYEKREWSKWTNPFINYVIPLLNCTYLLRYLVTDLYSSFYENFYKPGELDEWLLHLVTVCCSVHLFLCIVFNHFCLRRELVSYLQLHSNVDQLLKLKKRQLKRFVRLLFILLVLIFPLRRILAFIMFDGFKKYFYYCYKHPSEIIADLSEAYIWSIAVDTHPYVMYFIYQRVLKSSFDQLLVEIKDSQNKNLGSEIRAKKMRKYMGLYCDLCKLCIRLDHMMSPLLLSTFVMHYLNVIHSLALSFYEGEMEVGTVLEIVSGVFVLVFVSNFAYLTKKSHDKILPAIYSTFISDEKAVKTELQNFSLQSMYFNKSFSVSGFFQLDRELILAIFHSLISQIVVFYKIIQEPKQNSNDQEGSDKQTLLSQEQTEDLILDYEYYY